MEQRLVTARRQAAAAFTAALEAVQPERLLPAILRPASDGIEVVGTGGLRIVPPAGRRLVLATGKAGASLADAWCRCSHDHRDELIVLVPFGVPVSPSIEARAMVLRGSHPYPDAAGVAATRTVLDRLEGLGADDALLVLLSGGTSALLAAPEPGLELADIQGVTRLLLSAGAPIEAVNTVRRQLLVAAGGGLARAASPAPTTCLVLSDVIGDPLESIGSGPTVASPTTAADALEVLGTFDPMNQVPAAVRRFLIERDGCDASVLKRHWPGPAPRTAVIANNRVAVEAAARSLREQGLRVTVEPEPVRGEASVRGRELVERARDLWSCPDVAGPWALVAGGETTVTVRGPGRGGRSQELALAAALRLQSLGSRGAPLVLLAAGTDGIDGTSDHAGAIVDPLTCRRARAAGVDPARALERNDSASALEAAGDAITTGPTGTNVCDLMVVVSVP